MIKAEIIKIHKSQEDVFPVGDIVFLSDDGKTVYQVDQNDLQIIQSYRTKDLTKAFSDNYPLSKIFKKL